MATDPPSSATPASAPPSSPHPSSVSPASLPEPAGAPRDTCVARVPIFSLLSPEDQQAVASFAIDDYEADLAIAAAQSALRRARARGGDFSRTEANRTEGSLLNQAFRLQGLDAWGRSYGDAVFDPFDGASLVDQAEIGRASCRERV